MSLRSEIIPYVDGNGLVAPNLVTPGTIRASDNGPMFTSEYYIMLNRNGELIHEDIAKYMELIGSCVGSDGHLHRAPGDLSQDEIDDHIGVLAAYAEFGANPQWSLPLSLYRFPQLIYAWLLAKGIPSILILPLSIINGIIIATSGIGSPTSDADSRRLNWDLLQATKRKSLLARLAGAFWHWRQTKVYKTQEVMKVVAATYYQAGHPFIKYWID